jgi:hypothetical protein
LVNRGKKIGPDPDRDRALHHPDQLFSLQLTNQPITDQLVVTVSP